MKELLFDVSEQAIVVIDGLALIVILYGTVEICIQVLRLMFVRSTSGTDRRAIWLDYARWLVAGLTFQLAADIVETSIHSDWPTIGRIAAVAVIRTFLNYFLERDLTEIRERQHKEKPV
jgi:uncharacterized membrane protein